MAHEHHHHEVSGKSLWWTILLNLAIALAEGIGGLISGSMALISKFEKELAEIKQAVGRYNIHHVNIQPEFSVADNKQVINN